MEKPFSRCCTGESGNRTHLPMQEARHKRHEFDPWVRKIPWRRVRQPTPVFLPGESHGQRSLVGYRVARVDLAQTSEQTSTQFTFPPCEKQG